MIIDIVPTKHYRDPISPTKSKESMLKRFGLGPINNPSILVSSPLNSKFDISRFHKQLEHLLIPENMVRQFKNMKVDSSVPAAFKRPNLL